MKCDLVRSGEIKQQRIHVIREFTNLKKSKQVSRQHVNIYTQETLIKAQNNYVAPLLRCNEYVIIAYRKCQDYGYVKCEY